MSFDTEPEQSFCLTCGSTEAEEMKAIVESGYCTESCYESSLLKWSDRAESVKQNKQS